MVLCGCVMPTIEHYAQRTIWPKSGSFPRMFWMIRFSTFCTKTHFPENQKSWPKALWGLACEFGSEFHKHPRMCERCDWRKQLRDFIPQSLKQTLLDSSTFSRLFWSNGHGYWRNFWKLIDLFEGLLRNRMALNSSWVRHIAILADCTTINAGLVFCVCICM